MACTWEQNIESALAQIRAGLSAVRGCSREQLAAFQKENQVTLPDAYVRFLEGAGMLPGDFLRGSDIQFDQLGRLQSLATHLLEEDGAPQLENGFVFCSHQGYQFLFFRLDGGPDPEVWHYLEGDGVFKAVAPSFSDWLVRTVGQEFQSS